MSRSWLFRYNSPRTGKLRWLGLGSVDLVPLAEARKLAQHYRSVVRIERRDPIEERLAMKAKAVRANASAMTFAQCVDAYIGPARQHLEERQARQAMALALVASVSDSGEQLSTGEGQVNYDLMPSADSTDRMKVTWDGGA